MSNRAWDQRMQDRIGRLGFKRLARRIFMWRIRWYVWRGRVVGARVTQGDDR